MKILAGTSGFSYKEWRGSSTPRSAREGDARVLRDSLADGRDQQHVLPDAEGGRARRLAVAGAGDVPLRHQGSAPNLAYQAPARNAARSSATCSRRCARSGSNVGSILFQLPPFAKRDTATLAAFVAELPQGCRAAFEFRNASWFDPEVLAVLRSRNLALVHSEEGEPLKEPLQWTADWAYLRLRRVEYTQKDLEILARAPARRAAGGGASLLQARGCGDGPKLAEQFLKLAGADAR